jgi:serpin B
VAAVSNWLDGAMRTNVQVSFPRFKFTQSFSLGEKLKALGMKDAFSLQTANFSGMTTTEKLCISDVIHKSFVAVDEVGTEAAAATGVAMVGEAAISPQEPKVFTADHPFLFLIRHNESGAILFIGRVASPEGGD